MSKDSEAKRFRRKKKDGYVGYATGVGTKPKRKLECFGWLYDRR